MRGPWLCLAAGAILRVAAVHSCELSPAVLEAWSQHSRWREQDAAGRLLVVERGMLAGGRGAWHADCAGVDFSAYGRWLGGTRSYAGVSNRLAPLHTVSRVSQRQYGLQVWWPLTAGWDAGMRLNLDQSRRGIASTAAAAGYEERFSRWQAALGARVRRPLGDSVWGNAQLELGAGPAGHLQVDLPREDPARLRTGASRLATLGLGLQSPPRATPGWSWHVGLQWQWQRYAPGPEGTLYRGGLPAGSAHQPAGDERSIGVFAGAAWRF